MKTNNLLQWAVSIFSLLFLSSCQKQNEPAIALKPEDQVNENMIESPSIQNGILKFSDFRSFRFYDASKIISTNRSSGSFVSMQTAFDGIVKADAILGEQLAKKYPSGPASVFNDTHTTLLNTFPKSVYVEGNSSSGFYYEINSFNKSITGKINKDGFVLVGEWLVQYSKDSLNMWLVGKAGINGRAGANVHLSANIHNDVSRETLNKKWEQQTTKSSSKTLTGWPPLSSDWRNTSCQNTIRSGGINRRVLGYVNYELYRNGILVLGSTYESSIANRSVSLKGRLFGVWYDSWTTGHTHHYNSYGPTQYVYPLYSNNINLNTGVRINWTWNDDLAFNGDYENETQSPTDNAFVPVYILWPETIATKREKPAFTYYNAKFTIASGYGTASDPTCDCAFTRP